jgi:hypothetical protein
VILLPAILLGIAKFLAAHAEEEHIFRVPANTRQLQAAVKMIDSGQERGKPFSFECSFDFAQTNMHCGPSRERCALNGTPRELYHLTFFFFCTFHHFDFASSICFCHIVHSGIFYRCKIVLYFVCSRSSSHLTSPRTTQ